MLVGREIGACAASSFGHAISGVAAVTVIDVAQGTSMHAQASPVATSVLHCSHVARSCWLQRQDVTGTSLERETDAVLVPEEGRATANAVVVLVMSTCKCEVIAFSNHPQLSN